MEKKDRLSPLKNLHNFFKFFYTFGNIFFPIIMRTIIGAVCIAFHVGRFQVCFAADSLFEPWPLAPVGGPSQGSGAERR